MRFAGIEAGGTKFVCAVGSGEDRHLEERAEFPTRDPDATLARVVGFLEKQPQLAAVGIASFGPIDVHRGSSRYGYITSTTKPGWRNVDIVGRVRQAYPALPVGFDTDVNGAALGEHGWGAARGLATFVYLTIGTGIGGGALIDGTPLHGLVHPEMGHLRIPHDWTEDPFPGVCPFHGDCWEGVASGPAIEQRWKRKAEHLPVGHPGWELEANYLAQGIANLILTLSPQRIILGGGVIQREALVARVRALTSEVLNGYIQAPELAGGMGDYIVRPELGQDAGVLGAITLARAELERDPSRGANASGDAGSHPA